MLLRDPRGTAVSAATLDVYGREVSTEQQGCRIEQPGGSEGDAGWPDGEGKGAIKCAVNTVEVPCVRDSAAALVECFVGTLACAAKSAAVLATCGRCDFDPCARTLTWPPWRWRCDLM